MRSNQNNGVNNEYIFRINKVLDYIDSNLGKELSLEVLSNVAHFSSYHFHRIFTAMVGEPLSKYIQRIRLEKAALMLASFGKIKVFLIARTVKRIARDAKILLIHWPIMMLWNIWQGKIVTR